MTLKSDAIPITSISHSATTGQTETDHHTATVETVHPDPSVDNAIARYNGIAGALQGYTSLAPTISDDGVMTLPSGQLTFPATINASADANTIDDVQEVDFTPVIWDSSFSDAESQTYGTRGGSAVKYGRFCWGAFQMDVSSLGTLTTSQGGYVGNMPFTAVNDATQRSPVVMHCDSLNIAAGQEVSGYMTENTTRLLLRLADLATGHSTFLLSELSGDGKLKCSFQYEVQQ